jgi:type IV secretion system protein VirB6
MSAPDIKPEIILKKEVSIGVACHGTQEDLAYNAVRTRFDVAPTDKIKISITGLSEDSSKIYLCGSKNVKLRPIFPNMETSNFDVQQSAWDNDNMGQNAWPNKSSHSCFANMTDTDFSNLTNKKIWSNNMGYTPCDWHARNPNYIDTDINIADGDELYISWIGEYVYTIVNVEQATRKKLFSCVRDKNTDPVTKQKCREILNNSSSMVLKDPSQSSLSFIFPNNHIIWYFKFYFRGFSIFLFFNDKY